jgi:hypothetical protein
MIMQMRERSSTKQLTEIRSKSEETNFRYTIFAMPKKRKLRKMQVRECTPPRFSPYSPASDYLGREDEVQISIGSVNESISEGATKLLPISSRDPLMSSNFARLLEHGLGSFVRSSSAWLWLLWLWLWLWLQLRVFVFVLRSSFFVIVFGMKTLVF